ncbi:hypothetical protein J2S43_001504 [Catenuloplanes nepalensis]|uniref:DUF4132 domain-containing protein n=1 Tax=Catenuloplanes nepalensis TaxID=587533 RepID=A0ABT9MNL7_9ACTN|nr:DUF4132 domain-containing protein [Catenuloplanes nepalensis]MDP9792992.1 hypothetical protein [Catenuloplanes nepalensis]
MGEDMITLPDGWTAVLPRRIDAATPVSGIAAPDPDAPAALAAIYAAEPGLRAAAIASPHTAPEIAAAHPDSPLGAAATAWIHHEAEGWGSGGGIHRVVGDAWLAEHGLMFAAEAAVWLFAVRDADHYGATDPKGVTWGYHAPYRYNWDASLAALYRVREALAAAPADVYAQVVDRLRVIYQTEVHDLHPRLACAFLAPAETGWTARLVDDYLGREYPCRVSGALLAACVTPADLDRLTEPTESDESWIDVSVLASDPGSRLLPTIVTYGGPAVTRLLCGTDRPEFVTLMSGLPYDETFKDLRNRAADRDSRPALLAAAARFPARAVRLLAEGAGRRIVSDLLRSHVVTHPQVAARVLPSLTGEPASRVAAILDEIAARADAKPETVPALPVFAGRKKPAVPEWMLAGVLPPLLRDGAGALPTAHVPALLTAFALSRVTDPWEHLPEVIAAFDPDDLARYVWDVFFQWYFLGGTAKENWTLDALGLAGNDDTVRRLTPTILAWPGEAGHARAVAGLGVLAAIGSEAALMALDRIAQRSSFKGLKNAARQRMAEVAAGLGLDGDQLADRLVPGFGLDAHGRTTIDYGPRAFTVGFDEKLTPYVTDGAGNRLKALPKPGAKDDPETAPAAHKRFTELKKEVRGVAGDLVARLERDMVSGRRITGAELRAHFVAHPLVRHLARRLVWGVYDDAGVLTGALRVAEDDTLADAHDEPVTLADDARVGVAHPVHLGDLAGVFGELFADYEILQPFPQLGREIYRLTAEEAAGRELTRLVGRRAPDGRLIALERRGWLRGNPEDAGIIKSIGRALPSGGEITVALNPGMVFHESGTQEFLRVSMWGDPGRLGAADPMLMSEIIRDLTLASAEE